MGTHSLLGFRNFGILYLMYNQFDGDSMWFNLLLEIATMLNNDQLDEWEDMFRRLKKIHKDEDAPEKAIVELEPYTDLSVSQQSLSDPYCLTRKCQGSFLKVLQSGWMYLYMEPTTESFKSLWREAPPDIEYMYVLNFDNNTFETTMTKPISFQKIKNPSIPLSLKFKLMGELMENLFIEEKNSIKDRGELVFDD